MRSALGRHPRSGRLRRPGALGLDLRRRPRHQLTRSRERADSDMTVPVAMLPAMRLERMLKGLDHESPCTTCPAKAGATSSPCTVRKNHRKEAPMKDRRTHAARTRDHVGGAIRGRDLAAGLLAVSPGGARGLGR